MMTHSRPSRPWFLGLDRMPRQTRRASVLAIIIVFLGFTLFTLWGPKSLEWMISVYAFGTPDAAAPGAPPPAPQGEIIARWGALEWMESRVDDVPFKRVDSAFQTLGGVRTIDMAPLLITIALTVLAGFFAWQFHRWAMRLPGPKGICIECGYDLRGSDSGRCPECGERNQVYS